MKKDYKYREFCTYHPIVNFMYFLFIIVITMFSMNPFFLGMSFIMAWIYSAMMKGSKAIKYNLMFLIPIMLTMVIINGLFSHNGATVLFYINTGRITKEALIYGFATAIMLTSMIVWLSCFGAVMTSDKIMYLLGRVIPVIALIISMIFRFIPLLKSRYREISDGQKCMGRDVYRSGVIGKIRQFFKKLSILIVWSLEASIETADSMEARGYGLHGRTSFHLFKFSKRDGLALILIVVFGAIVITACAMGKTDIYYYPEIRFPKTSILTILSGIAYFLLMAIPMFIDIKGELKWKRLSLEM